MTGTAALPALLALVLATGCGEERPSSPGSSDPGTRRRLESLGYVNRVPVWPGDPGGAGVTIHDAALAWEGLNLLNVRQDSGAELMTMDGKVVHRWASDRKGRAYQRFREAAPTARPEWLEGWNHIEPVGNGDLLVIGSHHMLLRLDARSAVVWQRDLAAHHDLAVEEDGEIHVLVDSVRATSCEGSRVWFQDNLVVTLSPEGRELRRISLYDALIEEPSLHARLLEALARVDRKQSRARIPGASLVRALRHAGTARWRDRRWVESVYQAIIAGRPVETESVRNVVFHSEQIEDVLHANSIQTLPRGRPGWWEKGDLLVCIRNLDLIVVLSAASGALRWRWGERELEGPHHATMLQDGSILIFDNGTRRRSSRIVRVDSETARIVWSYEADPPKSFYSSSRGGCQPLPNGNVLIAETNRGRAFEVTPAGEVVWEYWDAVSTDRESGKASRGALYRVTRLDEDDVSSWLLEAGSP